MHAWAHGSGRSLVLLARWAAQAEEGVGALELLDGVLLDDGADLADGVALADDVVAGVEPGEGEVALGAAPQLATVGLRVALALPDDRGSSVFTNPMRKRDFIGSFFAEVA